MKFWPTPTTAWRARFYCQYILYRTRSVLRLQVNYLLLRDHLLLASTRTKNVCNVAFQSLDIHRTFVPYQFNTQ